MDGRLNVNSVFRVCRFNINHGGGKKRIWWNKYIKSNQQRLKKNNKESQSLKNETDKKIRGQLLDFTHYVLDSISLFELCTKVAISLFKDNTQVLNRKVHFKKGQTEETLNKKTSLGIKWLPSFLRTFWERLNIIKDFNRCSRLNTNPYQDKVQRVTG